MRFRILGLVAVAVAMLGIAGAAAPASAQNWSWMPGTSFRGASHTWRFTRDGMTPRTCQQLCQQRRGCRSWTWYPGQYDSAGLPVCLMYTRVYARQAAGCCTSGIVRNNVGPGPGPGPGTYRQVFNYPRWNGRIVDHCVTWASNCGWGGANYYCRLRGFQRAANYSSYRPGGTYVIGSRRFCNGPGCVGFRQVTCIGRRTGVTPPPPGPGPSPGRVVINYPRFNGAIVDHCSSWATNCGWGGANRYCRTRGFSRAISWSRYRPGRTYVIGSGRYCNGPGCVGFRQVTCQR